jgi:hypothetical protein
MGTIGNREYSPFAEPAGMESFLEGNRNFPANNLEMIQKK